MRALLTAMLFALSGTAGAQAPASQSPGSQGPGVQPPERVTPGETRLNLNLDEASRRQILREMPADRGTATTDNTLPGLGTGRGSAPSAPPMNDIRPFPRSGMDPAPTAPPPR